MSDAFTPKVKSELRVLCHVHTRRSSDAWITPQQILSHATARAIDLVIVTDHNTHMGSVDCRALAGNSGPTFPMAAEYRSTSGDMIAAFLTSPITSRDPLGILNEAHAQGAIVILPHPFKHSRFSDAVFEQTDLIEVFNARCTDSQNNRARAIAETLNKATIVGPDAHFQEELGLALNRLAQEPDLKKALLTTERSFDTSKTTLRSIRKSQMLKAVRKAQPIAFGKGLVRWMQANPTDTP